MARSGRFQPSRGGGGNGARGGPRSNVCFQFKRHGQCSSGDTCKYSHDVGSTHSDNHENKNRKFEETPDQLAAKARYKSWKRLLRKPPQANDVSAMVRLWDEALEILDSNDRDWRQTLARDLDREEADDDYGRHYIKAIMDRSARVYDHPFFLEASRSFLLVMTHTAMVDCLSVDTYVGSLYNFMSGANGKRAIPFLQHLCKVLVATYQAPAPSLPTAQLDSTLIALSNALHELLRREPRIRFNEDLPGLLDSLEGATPLTTHGGSTLTADTVTSKLIDCRAMVARAHGLLVEEPEPSSKDTSTATVQSSYPRSVTIPGGRHDNDDVDITKISLFPTREEILSGSRDYLPSTDPDQPQFLASKQARHIDTLFRLLRHDTFGTLKDALGGVLNNIINDPNQMRNPRIDSTDTRMNSYPTACVKYLEFTGREGLQAHISFLQPYALRAKTAFDRRRWWEDSKRLEDGVLLSFIWLQNSTVQHLFFTVKRNFTDTNDQFNLTKDVRFATITAKPETQGQEAIVALLGLSQGKTEGILLEFPHMLPATFVPVLGCLQDMQRLSTLPFDDWILPDRIDGPVQGQLDIPAPLYARSAGFAYPMAPILVKGATPMSLQPTPLDDATSTLTELETKTGLDHGQCAALVAALTREFAFIQGPPGTGKSYLGVKLMQVLLGVREKAKLGPVVVVCYTNHALDQFLEHLIREGIQKVIRVGGRSASEMLENHNLRKIARDEGKSKHDKWQAATAYRDLEKLEKSSRNLLGRLHGMRKQADWKHLDRHLQRQYNCIHSQFPEIDDDGFTHVGRHLFDIWSAEASSKEEAQTLDSTGPTPDVNGIIEKAGHDVHSLSPVERSILLRHWICEAQEDTLEEFLETLKEAESVQKTLANVHYETDRNVLQEAEVIGLTTSGLAKNISTLRHVRAKVVICEEAGEVLEPHMICALLPKVEHFIQIGDHQQLRPSISNFRDLSLESAQGKMCQLDRSQFERLSVGERERPVMPVAQLNVQRRMRPDISVLIRETIYSKLQDHRSTLQLPDVVGLRNNVFWFDHQNLENANQAEVQHKKSHVNLWEVEMVHALVRHVVRQGVYSSRDIAVLTPYTGQLQRLRAAMRNDFEIVLSEKDREALAKDGFSAQDSSTDQPPAEQGNKRRPLEKKQLSDLLRIATVDNFQGEEAQIIIISLVRSNKERKVGFLKTTNRINVLLSRAQHGMYLIGNTDTYSNVPMWQKVIDMLRAESSPSKSSTQKSSSSTAPREVAAKLAWIVSQTAGIGVSRDAILRLCMMFGIVSSLVNAAMHTVAILARCRLAARIADSALLY
ncbi:hypothetical protein Q7P37_011464 [Cladosporium fusiforme]